MGIQGRFAVDELWIGVDKRARARAVGDDVPTGRESCLWGTATMTRGHVEVP